MNQIIKLISSMALAVVVHAHAMNKEMSVKNTSNNDLCVLKKTDKFELINAVKERDRKKAKNLIEGGIDLDFQDDEGGIALGYAIRRCQLDIAILLIEKGADFHVMHHGRPCLIWALKDSMQDVAKLLINKGANIHRKCKHNWTPLALACGEGLLDIVKMLIAKDVDIDSKNGKIPGNVTPLCYALARGRVDTAKILIQTGCNIYTKDDWGCDAFYQANRHGFTEIITLLKDLENFPNNNQKAVAVFKEMKKNNTTFAVPALKMLYENKKNYRHIMHCIGLCNEYKSTSNLLKKLMKEERLLLTLDREVLDKMNLVYDEKTVAMQNKLVLRNQDSDLCDINIIYFQNNLF